MERMKIDFSSWDEWQHFINLVKSGIQICPRCLQPSEKVYRIPKRYLWKGSDGSHILDFGCAYCIAKLAQKRREMNTKEVLDCCECGGEFFRRSGEVWGYSKIVSVFGVAAVSQMQRKESRRLELSDGYIPPNLCPSCVENLIERRKVIRKEAKRVASQNARTRKLGLVSDLTIEQWLRILELYSWRCRYCGNAFSDLDHIVPVSFGGGTTAKNVVPSCSTCNGLSYRRFRVSQLLQLEDRYSPKHSRR